MKSYALYIISTADADTPERIAAKLHEPPHEWHERLKDAETVHGVKLRRTADGYNATNGGNYYHAFKIEISKY